MTTAPQYHLAIREASLADAATIAALITQLGYPATTSEILDRLAYWLPDPMSVILVAETDGRVIGSLSLHRDPLWRGKRTMGPDPGHPSSTMSAALRLPERRRSSRRRRRREEADAAVELAAPLE